MYYSEEYSIIKLSFQSITFGMWLNYTFLKESGWILVTVTDFEEVITSSIKFAVKLW